MEVSRKPPIVHKAVFPARYESLASISRFIRQVAAQADLDSTVIYRVDAAVDEACSNIIEHAYGDHLTGNIECTCQIDDTALTIILRDDGRPFNPNAIPEPDITAPLEERTDHGLGLLFIRKWMDEVHYEFSGQGNTLTLVKYRNPHK